ncbi:type VII secretion system-associated protein [Amycolatopsis sp. PS_44_ISF1]|uniref:type VII secretion system-associated protein n=1 Tax=Amycolatopsis sp. PS_44_ISF1 TaxID=2974917 RepID=UPI0028DDA340|nr:type VII secretion system-associated protein [Amycolatopsis sp. PS_44_ISF1]MDT8912084.1 type VII secretion system-associated protein [Amycolatopsis sp. PS_44_ISF1]
MTGAAERDQVRVLVDPAWKAAEDAPEPLLEALVGAWPILPDGSRDRFRSNPSYRPSAPGLPLDPVDAVLGAIARGAAGADDLPALLRDAELGVAVDERGVVIVRPAADGTPSAMVTTAYGHRERVPAADWRTVSLAELAEALPEHGVDVLLNPGAPTSLRLYADAVRGLAVEDRPS